MYTIALALTEVVLGLLFRPILMSGFFWVIYSVLKFKKKPVKKNVSKMDIYYRPHPYIGTLMFLYYCYNPTILVSTAFALGLFSVDLAHWLKGTELYKSVVWLFTEDKTKVVTTTTITTTNKKTP
jgi:hypothetical protein